MNSIPNTSENGIVTITSPHSYTETIYRLKTAFQKSSIKIFAVIDQQAEAAAVNLHMPPTTLIIFGNPAKGTILAQAQPICGLDLPLKVLITELSGNTVVCFNSSDYIIKRYSLPADLIIYISGAGHIITNALTP